MYKFILIVGCVFVLAAPADSNHVTRHTHSGRYSQRSKSKAVQLSQPGLDLPWLLKQIYKEDTNRFLAFLHFPSIELLEIV